MTQPPSPDAPHLDPTRWSELIQRLDAATIFVVIGGLLGSQARRDISIDDVWQETLWMAWRDRHQHTWTDLTAFRAWLLGIARHRVGDLERAAGRVKRGGAARTARFSDIGGTETVGGVLPPQSTTPSRVVSQLERARVLERILAEMDEPLRVIVRLRLFEELPMATVATQLGIPLSTAKQRFVRGLEQYRSALRRLDDGQDVPTRDAGDA